MSKLGGVAAIAVAGLLVVMAGMELCLTANGVPGGDEAAVRFMALRRPAAARARRSGR